MSRTSEREGLSLGYRIAYRLRYVALQLFGPATLGEVDDPQARLRRERAAKVAGARAKREGARPDPVD